MKSKGLRLFLFGEYLKKCLSAMGLSMGTGDAIFLLTHMEINVMVH